MGFVLFDDIQTLFNFKLIFLHRIGSGFSVVDDIQTPFMAEVNFFQIKIMSWFLCVSAVDVPGGIKKMV